MKTILSYRSLIKLMILICLMVNSNNISAQLTTRETGMKSGYAPVNGQKIYYEIYGEGKPVVLLHGAYMTINMNWAQLIPELSKTRKVIAIEMQGHGHTALGERPYSYETLADDVAKTLQHLKIDSADVIGYSFGGTVAYKLVIDRPSIVNKMIIISSTYKYNGWQKEVRDVLHTMKPEYLINTPLKTEYDKVAADKSNWTNFLTRMIEFDKVDYNLGDDKIKSIKSPVLLISGDNDGVDKNILIDTYKNLGGCTFADMTGVPKSQLAILPAQGHVSLMMETETILKYVKGFLK